MQSLPLSADGRQLQSNLLAAGHYTPNAEEKIHIIGVASGLYVAYERLRNATEYAEQHLLLRAAIERFLRRNMLFRGTSGGLGHELIAELTQAGYIKNDTLVVGHTGQIDEFIGQYSRLAKTVESKHHISHEKARRWTVQVLSVCIEKMLVPDQVTDGFIDFAYKHYSAAIDRTKFASIQDDVFDDAIYIAVHRALFKSDIATIRFYLYTKARATASNQQATQGFIEVCKMVDTLFQGPLANHLTRIINRYGAPMRILREVITDETDPSTLLQQRTYLLKRARAVVEQQYDTVHEKLVKGILRAIIFIFITKMLVGLAVEVPYDLLVLGMIVPLPLVVNLLFPPLYMATAGWSIAKPGQDNTEAIVTHIDRMLYKTDHPALTYKSVRRIGSHSLRTSFNIVYGLAFVISFGLVILLLQRLEFSLVHGVIFFIFFSAVSFLRFRLIQTARELELVDNRQSLASTIGDFFYTPFIRLGQWLSDQYKQVNVINILLDFAIELPLKTSLRLLRQWASFMRDKREEM